LIERKDGKVTVRIHNTNTRNILHFLSWMGRLPRMETLRLTVWLGRLRRLSCRLSIRRQQMIVLGKAVRC
jgi:hypothetical protein